MNTTPTEPRHGRHDARLLLSYGQRSRSLPRAIHVLVVGVADSEELIQQVELSGDTVFQVVDPRARLVSELRRTARSRHLENVEFEATAFQGDWLAVIDVPFRGFDVVQVGALHGQDLASLLRDLQAVMADHTAVSLELPAGKQHGARVASAIAAACGDDGQAETPLAAARHFVDRMVGEEPQNTDWRRASLVSDDEFAARYLSADTASMDVAGLFAALDAAGMTFLRWSDTAAWSIETLELPREELEQVRSLPAPEQFQVVEAARRPDRFELVVGGPNNTPRERFDLTKAGETHFMVHPGLVFSVETRNQWGVTEYDRLTVRRAGEAPVEVKASPAQTALFALRDQREPFSGLNLVEVMTAEGASLEEALLALHQLVGMELLYRPHAHDVAQYFSAQLRQESKPDTGEVVVTPSIPQKNSIVPAAGEPAAPLPSEDAAAPSGAMTNPGEGGRKA